MPRRGAADATLVLELLRGHGVLDEWEVTPLQGLTRSGTAAALQDSAIFLHFTYQEGFGLPAAEAMACGNLVIGFHGFGALELFDPQFSRPVPTGDAIAYARTVEDVLDQEAASPGYCRARGLEAARFVHSTYTQQFAAGDVVRFYRGIIDTHPRLAGHFNTGGASAGDQRVLIGANDHR
jgi:glycosyltransferase involved in cell wall biosynthesis